MSRPASTSSQVTAPTASSATATNPTTTTVPHGPTHKRGASVKHAGPAPIPPTASLFAANLRLLNLDLLPDWPGLTAATLTSQHDARTKIRHAEYALYQLFRLHDPAITAEKLQPFFPPLEPLQSVNLRAALFRCLNELKKAGVLGRETVLRKSMLDECSGEKFWEVCLLFSGVVLRKVGKRKGDARGTPVAQTIGASEKIGAAERKSLLPLAVAHRAVLGKVLEEKKRKREGFTRLHEISVDKEGELAQRSVRSEDYARRIKKLQPEKLRAVEHVVQKGWVGDPELKDALVDGDTCAKGDGMLVVGFDKLWQMDGADVGVSPGAEVGLLQSLNSKVIEQGMRLRRWQSFHEQLLATKPTNAKLRHASSASHKLATRFDQHRQLNLSSDESSSEEEEEASPRAQPKKRAAASDPYSSILATMHADLSKNKAEKPATHPSRQPAKRSQTQPNLIADRRSSLAPSPSATPGAHEPHRRSPSQTAVPVRPSMNRRASSRSRSYQQPKVISQKELVPLKSEMFSPLKSDQRRSGSVGHVLDSPAEESESSGERVDTPDVDGPADRRSGPAHCAHDSGLGIRMGDGSADSSARSSTWLEDKGASESSVTSRSDDRKPETASDFQAPVRKASSPAPEPTDLPTAAEATPTPKTRVSRPASPPASAPAPASSTTAATSLADRTRQSIASHPGPATTTPKKPTHARSRTSLYPVNQFATPQQRRGGRRSTVSAADGDESDDEDGEEGMRGKRVVTPIEQLLSPDADQESVFKARPRVAMSPVRGSSLEMGGF